MPKKPRNGLEKKPHGLYLKKPRNGLYLRESDGRETWLKPSPEHFQTLLALWGYVGFYELITWYHQHILADLMVAMIPDPR